MSLTLHIPVWLLWLVGVPIALAVVVCAALGVWLLHQIGTWHGNI